MTSSWARNFLVICLAQVGVFVATGLVGAVLGILGVWAAPADPMNLGRAIYGIVGALAGFLLSYLVLWVVVWLVWFRRMRQGQFLLGWAGSLAVVILVLRGLGHLQVGEPKPVQGEPLEVYVPGEQTRAKAFAVAPQGSLELVDSSGEVLRSWVEKHCEQVVEQGRWGRSYQEVCFALLEPGLMMCQPASLKVVGEQARLVWWLPGWFSSEVTGIEIRPLHLVELPEPRVTGVSWRVREGKLSVTVESRAPLIVDEVCFQFDGQLIVKTATGSHALLVGGYQKVGDREMVCETGQGEVLPQLVEGRKELVFEALPKGSTAQDYERVAKQIEEHGLAGGRWQVATLVWLAGHWPNGERVQTEAQFTVRPEL